MYRHSPKRITALFRRLSLRPFAGRTRSRQCFSSDANSGRRLRRCRHHLFGQCLPKRVRTAQLFGVCRRHRPVHDSRWDALFALPTARASSSDSGAYSSPADFPLRQHFATHRQHSGKPALHFVGHRYRSGRCASVRILGLPTSTASAPKPKRGTLVRPDYRCDAAGVSDGKTSAATSSSGRKRRVGDISLCNAICSESHLLDS